MGEKDFRAAGIELLFSAVGTAVMLQFVIVALTFAINMKSYVQT